MSEFEFESCPEVLPLKLNKLLWHGPDISQVAQTPSQLLIGMFLLLSQFSSIVRMKLESFSHKSHIIYKLDNIELFFFLTYKKTNLCHAEEII